MNQLLNKFLEKNRLPITSNAQVCQFSDYFSAKIEQIYSDMPYQNCNKWSCAFKFRKFEPLSLAGLKAVIESIPSKACDLVSLPTSIL